MPILVNWYASKGVDGESTISGAVFGDDRFYNGYFIHTSRIMSIKKEGNVFKIQTQNTLYECNLSMHILSRDMQLTTSEVLVEYGFTREETNTLMKKMWDAFFALDGKKKKLLSGLIPRKSTEYNVLEFSSEEEYYFRFLARQDEKGLRFWTEESLYVTIGSNQSIAEIRPEGLESGTAGQIVFRFWPYGENHLRLCEGYEKYGGLSLRNGGLSTLTIEDGKCRFEVEPGKCIVLNGSHG